MNNDALTGNLFTACLDYHYNACINWTNDTDQLYIEGYKNAADILVNEVLESNWRIDSLIYPIVFLYRQYIELELKYIIKLVNWHLNRTVVISTDHNVKVLWEEGKKCIVELLKVQDCKVDNYLKEAFKYIKTVTDEISKVDIRSYAFRFPTNKEGSKNLAGLKHINVRNLAEQMSTLSDKFSMLYYIIDSIQAGLERERGNY